MVINETKRYSLVKPARATVVRRLIFAAASVLMILLMPLTLKIVFAAFAVWMIAPVIWGRNPFVELGSSAVLVRGRFRFTAQYKDIEDVRTPGENLPSLIDRIRRLYLSQPGAEMYRANLDLVLKRPVWVLALPPWRTRVFPLVLEDPLSFERDLTARLATGAR